MSVTIGRSIASYLGEGLKFIVTVLLLTFALFYVGCVDLDGVDLPVTADGKGLVKRVDSLHKQVTISHDKVDPVVDALTLAYPVRDLAMLDSLDPGDSVSFTVREDEPGSFLITRLERLH